MMNLSLFSLEIVYGRREESARNAAQIKDMNRSHGEVFGSTEKRLLKSCISISVVTKIYGFEKFLPIDLLDFEISEIDDRRIVQDDVLQKVASENPKNSILPPEIVQDDRRIVQDDVQNLT
ncbi:hypothetical protein IEQ34_003195 [Dendrobium chrysotoxum]|uniref:Uncharacterized protein n=1 Tax=Dendrobium chrysotoxum TaxID=161865 RepID=A0AAV7HGW9_DENCH|nr:hypothetical protein IEQ34_003195 [Dendrobium chrysotoxum]